MIALDTNVLARALGGDDPQQTPIARSFIEKLTPETPGFVSLTVTVELFWVLTRLLGRPPAEVLEAFDAMLATEALVIEDGESVGEALEAARGGADFPDALIHATSRLYGVEETVSFDRKAAAHFGWRLLA